MAITPAGIVRPSALAVFMLITNSNFVGVDKIGTCADFAMFPSPRDQNQIGIAQKLAALAPLLKRQLQFLIR